MRIRLVAVGRVRSGALREACEEYVRRLARYQKLDIREVKEAGRRGADPSTTRLLEAEALSVALPSDHRIVALSRGGTSLGSPGLAERLRRWRDEARDVAFVIGGAWGLDNRILEQAEFTLSLSAMTLPHELARLVLLEQLYRACTILSGEPYHKGPGGA